MTTNDMIDLVYDYDTELSIMDRAEIASRLERLSDIADE